jgi:hypothetical protein
MQRRQFLRAGLSALLTGAGLAFAQSEAHGKDQNPRRNISDELDNISHFLLEGIGVQGGYSKTPEPKHQEKGYIFNTKIPIYYNQGNLKIPTIKRIEKEISDKAEEVLAPYINKRHQLNDGYIQLNGKNEVVVSIDEKEIIARADILMDAQGNGQRIKRDFSRNPIVIRSNLYNMHKLAAFIAKHYKRNNEWTPFSDISELSDKYDLATEITDSKDGRSNIITIKAKKPDYYPTKFLFMNRFRHSNLSDLGPLIQ